MAGTALAATLKSALKARAKVEYRADACSKSHLLLSIVVTPACSCDSLCRTGT